VLRIAVPGAPAMLKVSHRVLAIAAEPSLREEQYFYCAYDDKSGKYYCMPVTTGVLRAGGRLRQALRGRYCGRALAEPGLRRDAP
jgi:hypothetical protein